MMRIKRFTYSSVDFWYGAFCFWSCTKLACGRGYNNTFEGLMLQQEITSTKIVYEHLGSPSNSPQDWIECGTLLAGKRGALNIVYYSYCGNCKRSMRRMVGIVQVLCIFKVVDTTRYQNLVKREGGKQSWASLLWKSNMITVTFTV